VKTCRVQFAMLLLAACAWGQSDGDVPLGDVARNIRKAKVTTKAADVRVDNDNFSKIMENSEARRMMSVPPQLAFGLGPVIPGNPVAAPDISCSLSFSARGIRLTDALGPAPVKAAAKPMADKKDDKIDVAKDLKPVDDKVPASELAKLEGPATIIGDSLQLSVFNGSAWQIEEITVGLTILRHPSPASSALLTTADRIVPASSVQIVAKRSDTLRIYQFKGTAAPNSRTTLTEPLGITLTPEQEWHWAIVEAKGTPKSVAAPVAKATP
jgi:hypothetical protein